MMAKQFYMLPHPAWDDFVRSRTEQILARQDVATMDLVAMLEARCGGTILTSPLESAPAITLCH